MGCAHNSVETAYTYGFSFIAERAIYSHDTTEVTVILTNLTTNPDPNYFIQSTDFTLEIFLGDEWKRAPYRAFFSHGPVWRTEPNQSHAFAVVADDFNDSSPANILFLDEFTPGRYRIVANVALVRFDPDLPILEQYRAIWGGTVWAEFEIAEP